MKPVIIGSGLAGIAAALTLSPMPVTLITAGRFGADNSSGWAQGGIAAALGDGDSPALHAEDTLRAGAGLNDPEAVKQITEDAPRIIEWLMGLGAVFDCDSAGKLQLGLEGGHSKRRIAHVGDASGAAIMKALGAAVRLMPGIEILENCAVTEVLAENSVVYGLRVMRGGENAVIATDRVLLAAGGCGALWKETTNPLSAQGQGLALAARAGAVLGDLEFTQFHPTAMALGRDPMPLASEALRGEGAVLVDARGERFTDELQPRDVVTNAIWKKLQEGSQVFLDARKIKNFAARFPAIHAICANAGIDPQLTPIPVRPAAHYHMGGVVTDLRGRTSVTGLWAAGEVANTGLHGANRLASNSLLEAAVMGRRAAEDIRGQGSGIRIQEAGRGRNASFVSGKTRQIRAIMSQHAGVVRNAAGLRKAVAALRLYAAGDDAALVALMIAEAALRREETRGSQIREDFPAAADKPLRQYLTLADILPETYPLAAGA